MKSEQSVGNNRKTHKEAVRPGFLNAIPDVDLINLRNRGYVV